MDVKILKEGGYEEAMLGLSLSYNQDPVKMYDVAKKLAFKGDGHNKFLESMVVWIDITAPRYWWSQFDTYRAGTTKQSGSTMHTLMDGGLTQDDFEGGLPDMLLNMLNMSIEFCKDLECAKSILPESFLQRRIVCTNYMALQRMIRQRKSHKLNAWCVFITNIAEQARYPQFLLEDKPVCCQEMPGCSACDIGGDNA